MSPPPQLPDAAAAVTPAATVVCDSVPPAGSENNHDGISHRYFREHVQRGELWEALA